MNTDHPCTDCPRHAKQHPELFALLTADQTGDVQIMLCRDCPGDPWPDTAE